MTPETYLKAELARLAHQMGSHVGGLAPMLGCAHLLRNRFLAGMGSWSTIICTGPLACGNTSGACPPFDLQQTVNRQLLAQIDDVYSGVAEDTYTCGGLYYAELHKPLSDWFKERILTFPEEHPRVANIGTLTFFK